MNAEVTGTQPHVPESLRILLHSVVDYAGLFPPAGLDMTAAVQNFADYASSEDAWILGRFVLPVARLDEFAAAAEGLSRMGPWRLSGLVGGDLAADLRRIAEFNAKNAASIALVDSLEMKAVGADHIHAAAAHVPDRVLVYFEVATSHEPAALIAAIAQSGARAKIRTGGLTGEAFPAAVDVARFIAECAAAGVPFKATAGLHHPVRCMRPFTYEKDSALGVMHGFLNVFLAAAFALNGASAGRLLPLLQEDDLAAFAFDEIGATWRDHRFDNEALARGRHFAASFGSCSFEEPVQELRELKFL